MFFFKTRAMWLFVWLVSSLLFSTTIAAPRRPLRLFPFVQGRQERDNGKQHEVRDKNILNNNDDTISRDENDYELLEDDSDFDDAMTPMVPSSHYHSSSLLQVPCIIEIPHSQKQTPVTTIIDTGAQVTVLSAEAAHKCGVSHFMDLRYAGQATGVGKCRVLGRIPAGCLELHLSPTHTIPCPAITVLDNDTMEMDLLLGLDFLRDAGAVLHLQKNVMILQSSSHQDRVVIPFIQSVQHDGEDDNEIVEETSYAGGWINNDILSSLERRTSTYDRSDDEDDDDESLDMSGV